jgi:hypothetical protein
MYQFHVSNNAASEAPEMAEESADAGQAADTMGIADNAAPEAGTSALPEGQSAGDPSGRADLTASFLAEIARAMRATAIHERERISSSVADTTVAHEQKVRERGTSEASELRKLALDDIQRIETTAAAEIQRIKDDAERQIGERRGALADYLERHAALIEAEIGRIHGAVDDYNAELDGFFGRLAEQQNPAEIARLAGLLPEPPDLDQVGAIARADAVDRIAHEADANEAIEAEGGDAGAFEPVPTGAAAATGGDTSETAPAGEADATVTEPAVGASPGSEPNLVGVMDPDAGTPVFDESDAPAGIEAVAAGMIGEDELGQAAGAADAPTASGISAAKLLRNLAPWTGPDRTSDDNSD